MVAYNIQILPSVIRKDLVKIPKSDTQKIMNRIKSLANNPRPVWSKKLSGREEYRARQGNYRILYVIEDEIKIVQVTKVGHRRHIYG
ncbi:MAG TPA: type II toxin-antitoxin system RelE/ParE family toxin [Verrucomicrobiae bacterium]|nr:type II toxin-antitoxin system RelE/ParE family toxin [Verrucomicrobiae bacterium]